MIDLCLFLSFSFAPMPKPTDFPAVSGVSAYRTVLYPTFLPLCKGFTRKVTDPVFYSQSCSHRAEHSKHKPHTSEMVQAQSFALSRFETTSDTDSIPCKRHSKRETVPYSRQSQKKPPAAISLTSPPPTAPGCMQLPQKAAIRQ